MLLGVELPRVAEGVELALRVELGVADAVLLGVPLMVAEGVLLRVVLAVELGVALAL